MAQEQLTPPDLERPWYYQNWFLIGTFILGWPFGPPLGVLWPVWGLLILRSPWHNHTLIKGLGWAMLVVGGVMFFRLISSDAGRGIATLVPGLVVTAIIQGFWTKFRQDHGSSILFQPDPEQHSTPTGDSSHEPAGARRRPPRRRRGRSRRF